MVDEKATIPYQTAFVYDCQCCKKSHTEFGQIKQPGVAITHREELKRNLLELIKGKFSEAHPGKKFDLDQLTIEEFVDGNKLVVDPQTIRPREVKGEDLTKSKLEKTKEGKDEVPLIENGLPPLLPPTDVASIKKMLDARMVEIRKREKEIDDQIHKLTGDLESMTTELAELEQLQKAAEAIAAKKKSGKEKKK